MGNTADNQTGSGRDNAMNNEAATGGSELVGNTADNQTGSGRDNTLNNEAATDGPELVGNTADNQTGSGRDNALNNEVITGRSELMGNTADNQTGSGRDNALNNNEEHINDDDNTDVGTEEEYFTLEPLGLGPGLWSTLQSMLNESHQSSVEPSSQEQSDVSTPRTEQAPTTVTSLEQASSDGGYTTPSTSTTWRRRGSLQAGFFQSRDPGSLPRISRSRTGTGILTSPALSRRVFPPPQLSHCGLSIDEDTEWTTNSRPETPVQEYGAVSPRTPVRRSGALDRRSRSGAYTSASPTFSQRDSPSLSPRLPPPYLAIDEDPVWTANSRPETPVQEHGTHASVPDRDSPFSSSSVHENNALSSRASAPVLDNPRPTPSRGAYKELLLQTIQGWGPYRDQVQRLKTLIHYEDDDEYSYIPEPTELMRERKRYEAYARERSIRQERAFHVYGTDELFAHDQLRCWVKLRLNIDPVTPYPPGYEAVTGESDSVSVAGTLFSQESHGSQSSDSHSSESSDPDPDVGRSQ